MKGEVKYWIDRNEIVTRVNQGWLDVSSETEGPGSHVVGKSVWDYFSDRDTKYLYRLILKQAWQSSRALRFPIRCDSPTHRRYMEMTVHRSTPDEIEITYRTTKEEAREVPYAFAPQPHSESPLIMCSWCNRIESKKGTWVEIDEATTTLGLLERTRVPAFSHSICADCLTSVMDEVNAL